MHTEVSHSRQPQKIAQILERSLWPLLIFSATLFSLLLASWFLVMPRVTMLSVNGNHYEPVQILELRAELQQQVNTLETERTALVLPQLDERSKKVMQQVLGARNPLEMLEQLKLIAASVTGNPNSLHIDHFAMDRDAVEFAGDIRNVGPRSIVLLASYVEEISQQPFVTEIERPAFVRQEDPVFGAYSPFTIRFHLR